MTVFWVLVIRVILHNIKTQIIGVIHYLTIFAAAAGVCELHRGGGVARTPQKKITCAPGVCELAKSSSVDFVVEESTQGQRKSRYPKRHGLSLSTSC